MVFEGLDVICVGRVWAFADRCCDFRVRYMQIMK